LEDFDIARRPAEAANIAQSDHPPGNRNAPLPRKISE
jgi:hypothetical protein